MSDFQRSFVRNFCVGLFAGLLCLLMYQPILSDLPHGHSPRAYALLTSSCMASFSMFFVLWKSSQDPPEFKYLIDMTRISTLIIAPLTFTGLFLFHWWGLGAGFINGAAISMFVLSLWGPKKPQPALESIASTAASTVSIQPANGQTPQPHPSSTVLFTQTAAAFPLNPPPPSHWENNGLRKHRFFNYFTG